jgi:hypothetical protein
VAACAAELIRWGVEQKLKRHCSGSHQIGTHCDRQSSPEGTPIFGLNWFNDRPWPNAPMNPPGHGNGRAASLLDRAARLFASIRTFRAPSVMSALCHKRTIKPPLPATQTDLADALGLSGSCNICQRTVTIHDWDKLQNFAEFNPEYLHLEVKSAISSQASFLALADFSRRIPVAAPAWDRRDAFKHLPTSIRYLSKRAGLALIYIRDFTNGRGSDVDGPIRHAKPDRRTHTHEVAHTRAVPHRSDILQPPLAAALQ